MMRRIVIIAVMMILSVSSLVMAGQQPGMTNTVFNKRFIPNIKPLMPYDRIVRITGAQGAKVGESKAGSAPVSSYRWYGGKGSVLNARVAGGKVLDATVLAPNKHTYSVDRNGKVSDLGD